MKSPLGLKIGILGGGQLARMLIIEGHKLGFSMSVLCSRVDEPAAQVTWNVSLGDPNKLEDVLNFARGKDVLTIESEFLDANLLAQAAKHTPMWPTPEHLATLQDRLPQKQLLQKYKIPTADFIAVSSPAELEQAKRKFKEFVLKKRQGGYDGYGTFIFRAKDAVENFDLKGGTYIAEKFIPFKREVAVQFTRSRNGDLVAFPLVETKQVDNRLDWLRGPVKHGKFADLSKKISKMLTQMNYVGTIAFELFDSPTGLLVNEIAPRVHNSGHYSLEALTLNQFAAHLQAVAGWPLAKPVPLAKAFAMVNLIGGGQKEISVELPFAGHLHWYGKKESRAGRKMGHVTLTGPSAAPLLTALLKTRKGIQA